LYLLLIDNEKCHYLTLKVNSLFSLKLDFIRTSEDIKERLLAENDEESSLVAEKGFKSSYGTIENKLTPALIGFIRKTKLEVRPLKQRADQSRRRL
jgi:hypothetical protein